MSNTRYELFARDFACSFSFSYNSFSPIYSELQLLQIREFTAAVTQNISDLEGRLWRSKLLRMSFLVRLGSLTILRSIRCNFFFLNNGKCKKKAL